MPSPIRFLALLVAIVAMAGACASNNVTELAAGDCFNDPEDGFELVADVPMIDCSEPHDNEVYFTYSIDALGTEESYFNDCLGEFTAYVGADYADSEIFIGMLWPTAEGFADGDDEVVRFGYLEPPNKLTGSIKGSGR